MRYRLALNSYKKRLEENTMAEEKKKNREEDDKKKLINRLNRIEGQIRGIKRLVEEDVYCVDILVQVSAVQSALNGFSKKLLGEHIRTCVAEDLKAGNEEVIDELLDTMHKLMR
jgi:DNA-binding FrmR family transcriptional regulator